MRTLLVSLLLITLSSAAYADEWRAKDGSTIAVYGSVTGPEWEAFVNDAFCTPTGPAGKALYRLYCSDGNTTNGEDVLRAKGGVTFRGKYYARVN